VRVFVAVELAEDLRRTLSSLQEQLRQAGYRRIRWVTPSGIHLTLRFCGEMSEDTVERLIGDLSSGAPCPPFATRLARLSVLPARGAPRVLCVEVATPERFRALAAWVEERVVAAGLPPERRPLHPHLTLGRFPGAGRPSPRDVPRPSPLSIEEDLRVEEFVLFRSHLGAGGARYEALRRFPLPRGGEP
jgi:RNA 2',3'-cyclic 3'-phosphodiesterase